MCFSYVSKCHLNTCPVGIATQQEYLREKFKSKPEHIINFFNVVSHETRQIMVDLGVGNLSDLVGHPEFLRVRSIEDHPKANKLDFS